MIPKSGHSFAAARIEQNTGRDGLSIFNSVALAGPLG